MYYAMTQEDLTISSQGKFPPVLSIQVGDIANQSQFLKKWGRGEAENKIGHSIPPPPISNKRRLPSFFVRRRQHHYCPGVRIMEYWERATNILDQYYLKWRQQQKLYRIAFHSPVGEGGSAD